MHNGMRGPSTENRGNVRGIVEPASSTKSYISVPSEMAIVTRVFGDVSPENEAEMEETERGTKIRC